MKKAEYKSPLGSLYFWFRAGNLIYASFSETAGLAWLKKHYPHQPAESSPLPAHYQEDLKSYFREG
ncbi:MAG: hypothetical protein GX335_07550, partial [Firmicutes bacterium]|nr:hypothetical protein [Bacillota bacterium]